MAKVQLDAILKLVDVQINPQVFRKVSQAVAGLPPALAKTNAHLKGTARNAGAANKQIKGMGQALTQNERAARLLLQRTAQFAILLPTFVTLNRAIQGSVKFLFEFDSALRDIVRIDISGLSDRMEEVGDAAIKTAVDFGVTATEVLGVTRIFKQAGFTIEESQAKAQAAILATQISTLSSAQAVEVFIAAQKQFTGEGEDAIAVLDKLAKVEDVAAVNASDVADAFRAGGNALAEFSGSIDDSIGLIAALREQSRKSGREIGTFLKTIQTRLFAAGDARTAVEALGVEVQNLDGSLRPTLVVLNELKTRFDALTESQAANAAKSIAGIRQFESLLATLNSLERANELSAESSQAAGTADEKRVITDAKLERQLGKLIAQAQAFAESLGDAGLEDTLATVLNLATKLLGVFTGLVDSIGDIGGNLTPLLALAGFTLGRGVFGLAGGGGGQGGSGGGKPGDKGFIGPLTKSQAALSSWTTDLKRAGGVIGNTGKLMGSLAFQTGTNLQISKQHGIQNNIDTQALKVHAQAVKANAVAFVQSQKAALKQTFQSNRSALGLTALTIAATTLPKAFNALEAAAGRLGSRDGLGGAAATFVNVAGSATTLGAQFAFISKEAAGMAAVFGAVINAGTKIFDAWEERSKGIDEILSTRQRDTNISIGQDRLRGIGGQQAKDFQDSFFEDLLNNVKGKQLGKELNNAVQDTLNVAAMSDVFRGLKLDGDALRESLFGNIAVIQSLVNTYGESIQATAESNDRLDQFQTLQEGLAAGSLSTGQAFGLLVQTLGAGVIEINEATQTLKRDLDFKEFKAAQGVTELADKIRTLGLELELAQLGPDALSDSVIRLQQELMLAERESTQTISALEERLAHLFSSLDEFAVGLNPAADSTSEFFNKLKAGVETLKPDDIAAFNDAIQQLPPVQRKAAKEILKIFESQEQARIDIQNKRNDLEAEQSARAQALMDSEAQAANNAFAATERFIAELAQFGKGVSVDTLSAFQDVQLIDVDKVLAGTSDLNDGVQELIRNAFGDPIIQAQNELQAVSAKTEAELNVLAQELSVVEGKLNDQANAADFASLTAKKLALELEMEKTSQQAAINSTEAKVKILEAEREAAEDAAEAERKRQELLTKLADAARAFDQELQDVQRSFEDFQEQKIADLLGEEADARSDLKDAQQEVLSSTQALSEAYSSLIKAQLEFNGAIAEAQIKSNLLARDIAMLTGEIFTFDGELAGLGNAFRNVLNGANITLEKRIGLERQLAEETLTFLQQARDEIVQAGLGVFGQSGAENQALGQGIQGLQFIAEKLGGSFEGFLNLTQGELSSVTETLLGLPTEFRQQILDALSFLPSTTSVGGFSVEQLTQAIGQVGAGVAPEAGLPSIEELNNQQVEQLTKLQELALQDAQLQFAQVIAAQEQLAAAEEAVEAAQILEERASENLAEVRDAVLEEKAVLDQANIERRELMAAVVAADDKNTLNRIQAEADQFAESNRVFREVGDNIVRGISSAIGAKLAVIEAGQNVAQALTGHIPNFAGGNLTPGEAASLLRAGSREKRAMPGGAGLAVANTSEAIIPMRAGGFIPNFQDGSDISAGISAIRGINETVVAAIARSVTAALSDLNTGGGQTDELLQDIVSQLNALNSTNDDISVSNATVATNTADTTTTSPTTQSSSAQRVEIVLQTNQNNSVSITGLENLRSELEAAVQETTAAQVDTQVEALFEQLDEIITALQERGILSAFGQTR